MSDFAIRQDQRRMLLEGKYKPLVFQGVLDPEGKDPLPFGCRPGARYVLAWKRATATVVDPDRGVVSRIPRHPTWFITVTEVSGGPRKPRQLADRPWVVRYTVTDIRDPDVFLRRGGGDSSVDELRAGAKPDRVWVEANAERAAEIWDRARRGRVMERLRERNQAKRRRAA